MATAHCCCIIHRPGLQCNTAKLPWDEKLLRN